MSQVAESVEAARGAATRLAKLETMLEGYSLPREEAVPLFAALLSLPVPAERYPPLALAPEQLKQQTEDLLVAWTLEEAERVRVPMMPSRFFTRWPCAYTPASTSPRASIRWRCTCSRRTAPTSKKS